MNLNGSSSAGLPLVVRALRPAADGVLAVDLGSPSGDELPAWTPGAHVDVAPHPSILRQYSLCGDLDDRRRWRVAVRRDDDGRGGSSYIHERVREGDVVRVGLPRNHFPLATHDCHLFVAGGIGITPILPMIRALEARGESWHLWYAGRSRRSMPFLGELLRYDDRVEVFAADEGRRLDVRQLLAAHRPGAGVYCCGPTGLVTAVQDACTSWPAGSVHVERFSPLEVDPASSEAFEVSLERSGLTVEVPADKSILEVLEANGVQVPFSCREGICGSCETFVVEGEPEHHDSVLSESERCAGESMMLCVSRAASPRLVLDL